MSKLSEVFGTWRESRKTILALIYLSFMLDNILLTIIVPILPDYLDHHIHNAVNNCHSNSSFGWVPMNKDNSSLQRISRGSSKIEREQCKEKKQQHFAIQNLHFLKKLKLKEVKSTSTPEKERQIALKSTSQHAFTFSFSSSNALSLQSAQNQPKAIIRSNCSHINKTLYETINIDEDSGFVGVLFSSRSFVQLLINPFVGRMTSIFGYTLPLLIGSITIFTASLRKSKSYVNVLRLFCANLFLVFALGTSYLELVSARSLHGIGSSCIIIAGTGLVAELYPNDEERGRMQGLVMGGIALGVLVGYPLGGFMYEIANSKVPPFILVAVLAFILTIAILALLRPHLQRKKMENQIPMFHFLRLTTVRSIIASIMCATSAMSILEPTLPIWLLESIRPQKWQIGTAFLPDSFGYLLGVSLLAAPAYRYGRHRIAALGLLVVATMTFLIPEAPTMTALALPHFGLGLGIGAVDASLMPFLATVVDEQNNAAHYGSVYAIAQVAVAGAYFLGPLIGGLGMRVVGFYWLMKCVSGVNLVCVFVAACTLQPPSEHQESQAILSNVKTSNKLNSKRQHNPEDEIPITTHSSEKKDQLYFCRLSEEY